jgi:hypothetical protein
MKRRRYCLAIGMLFISALTLAQSNVKIVRADPVRRLPATILVTYTGTPPSDTTIYTGATSWSIWHNSVGGPLIVSNVDLHRFDFSTPQIISIGLDDPSLTEKDMLSSVWTVQFNQAGQPATVLASTPKSDTKCDGTPGKPAFLCPPTDGAPPDISISGTFIAGGGTKPIYTFQLIGGLYAPNPVDWLWKFSPGVSAAVNINQNLSPPNNRTTFDPDSIIAAFSLQKLVNIKRGNRLGLTGLEFDESLPGGEFSRSDPSSNIIFASTMTYVFKPIRGEKHPRYYGTVFPIMGIEAGKNLNKPQMIAKTPVDLSHYDAILRGYAGADVTFGIMSNDKTATTPATDAFTITGSYRVRLPAFDEPFVETMHQVTTVTETTKARNWFEGDINYAPWSFKYLTLTAKYQYGELPPLFNLVDHAFTLGITFQAVQSNKQSPLTPP